MRVTLIHNPTAGDGGRPHGHELEELIRRHGHEIAYRSSKTKNWKTALDDPGDLVAVAAGDGTVAKVAKKLLGRSVPLAILPTGTANNIATTLGLANTPIESLIAGWPGARRVGIDVGMARGPWGKTPFMEALGTGVLARTMARLEAGPDDSEDSARRILAQEQAKYPRSQLTITLDGRDLSGDNILLEAMNMKYVGPNLCLAPDADPGDGLLDLVLASDRERDKLGNYLPGTSDDRPALPHYRGECLCIGGEGLDIHIDDKTWPGKGETPPRAPTNIEITVARHALIFLVPDVGSF